MVETGTFLEGWRDACLGDLALATLVYVTVSSRLGEGVRKRRKRRKLTRRVDDSFVRKDVSSSKLHHRPRPSSSFSGRILHLVERC